MPKGNLPVAPPSEVPTHQVSRVYTHAEIIAMSLDVIELLPPPGAGKVIIAPACAALGGIVMRSRITANYTNVDPTVYMRIYLGDYNYNGPLGGVVTEVMNGLLKNSVTGGQLFQGSLTMQEDAGICHAGILNFENLGVKLWITNGSAGALTGGHVNHKLTVNMLYRIYNLTTGLFE